MYKLIDEIDTSFYYLSRSIYRLKICFLNTRLFSLYKYIA